MDISTLIGTVLGVVLILVSLLGDSFGVFFNLPSFMIVIGGAVAATFINFPMKDIMSVFKVTQKLLKYEEHTPTEYIEKILNLAKKARTNGLLGIEDDLAKLDSPFLRDGLQNVVNGAEPEDLRNQLEAELAILGQRHKVGQKVYISLGTYAPAFGMVGTLIGLIKMLQNLEDPAAIGPGMALAMITTFYGALFSNLFFLPMAGKLKKRSEEEMLFKEMLLQGILSVQAEESPRVIRAKLLTYVAPSERTNGVVETEVNANEQA